MGFIRPTKHMLRDALEAAIAQPCETLRSISAHAKSPEYREKVLAAFFSIFDTISQPGDGGKWAYQFSNSAVAERTGYSAQAVGYYKTLWENRAASLTVTLPATLVVDKQTGLPVRDEAGEYVFSEPETVNVKVSESLKEVDVAELARAIRADKRGETSKPSAHERGGRKAKALLAGAKDERTAWLQGFVGFFEQTGNTELRDMMAAIHPQAARKSKVQEKAQSMHEGHASS